MRQPLNYIPGRAAADIVEEAMSAIMLELACGGAPEIVIDRTIASLRRDFDRTRLYLRDLERAAGRRGQFGALRLRRVMAG